MNGKDGCVSRLLTHFFRYVNNFIVSPLRVALGTMIPESGGMYVYLHEAFGPLIAFLYMWVTAVMRNNAGSVVVALTFSSYMIQGIVGECEAVPDAAVRLVAAILICEHNITEQHF